MTPPHTASLLEAKRMLEEEEEAKRRREQTAEDEARLEAARRSTCSRRAARPSRSGLTELARLVYPASSSTRKKKKWRKKQLPKFGHGHARRRRGSGMCLAAYVVSSPRAAFPSVVFRPKMLGIMTGMNQKDLRGGLCCNCGFSAVAAHLQGHQHPCRDAEAVSHGFGDHRTSPIARGQGVDVPGWQVLRTGASCDEDSRVPAAASRHPDLVRVWALHQAAHYRGDELMG